MAQAKKVGICCICGKHGPLSFEHVPPQAAFNKATAVEYKWKDNVTQSKSKGKSIQGGVGAYTLCEQCNNDTGSWYANEYVKWARTCHRIMMNWNSAQVAGGTVCFLSVHPLRFLKQIVTCFFSEVGAPGGDVFARNNPGLVQFVLDKQDNNLPAGIRFFMNLYNYSMPSTSLRRFPLAGKITVQHDANFQSITPVSASVFSEIAHPPFQLAMTLDNMQFPGATEITDFSQHKYDDSVNLEIDLRVVSSAVPYPGAG